MSVHAQVLDEKMVRIIRHKIITRWQSSGTKKTLGLRCHEEVQVGQHAVN